MNGFPQTYSVDPESTGQRPHDQIDNLIAEHEGSSLLNLLSFLYPILCLIFYMSHIYIFSSSFFDNSTILSGGQFGISIPK